MPSPTSRRFGKALRPGVASVALMLSACAAPKIPPYVAPSAGPTARLVVRGQLAPTDAAYGAFVFGDSDRCSDPRLVGVGNQARHPATTQLAADRMATVAFVLMTADKRSCSVRWSFTPTAGRTYLIQGGPAANGCRAAIFNASDPDHVVREPGTLRRDAPGQACLSLTQARAATVNTGAVDPRSGEAVLNPAATADDLKLLMP